MRSCRPVGPTNVSGIIVRGVSARAAGAVGDVGRRVDTGVVVALPPAGDEHDGDEREGLHAVADYAARLRPLRGHRSELHARASARYFLRCSFGQLPAGVAGGLRAQAVELVAMAQHGEAAEPLRDPILQALDLVVLELEDEAALHADQVIVVIADDLVARLAVAELALDREARCRRAA